MELLTVKNESMVKVPDGPNPIINPVGPLASGASLSVGNAALAAQGKAQVQSPILGLIFPSEGFGLKNVVFLGFIGFVVYKYGRKIL